MTPALSAVYEELIARAAAPPLSREAEALRAAFVKRTGAFPDDHPSRAARDAAAWEDVLVAGGLAHQIGDALEDPGERAMADVIGRGQRGVFRVVRAGQHRFVVDLWGDGAFLLLPRDEHARAEGGPGDAVLVARIVAGTDGCAVLPGIVWLPAEAAPLLDPLLAAARARSLTVDALADALLRMDHALATMSRVKVAYAFREAALDAVPASREGPR